ncbi:hypothetical protein GCK72_017656 [Caenorhabditis remanei]|uniref:Uncharacterized protein n=1 Tax=Caenorhabditis remanei TaxID=31234 RepID=A0A6A5G935_CAERE|nr:hypothetical protein GCK72_017656 [Caenorhabditis remanei]KAF1751102.1 hypothetical protein GCK72_017656 [Caenorhabditis remanei]
MFDITSDSYFFGMFTYLQLHLMPDLYDTGEHTNPTKIFGMEPGTVCCLSYSTCPNVYLYRKKQKEAVIQGVHEYLCQFFGSSINYTILSKKTTELPPILKGVSGSDFWIPDETTQEELESYFNDYPIQKRLKLHGKLNRRLIPNSVVYRNEYLELDCCGNYGEEMLHNFKGSHLVFVNTNFRDSTIIQFLNKWKTNQGFQHLKSFSIDLNLQHDNIILFDKKFDHLEIKRNIDVRHLKPSEDALLVKWREIKTDNITLTCRTEEMTLESRDYLIRDGDGKGATTLSLAVGISMSYTLFFKYHKINGKGPLVGWRMFISMFLFYIPCFISTICSIIIVLRNTLPPMSRKIDDEDDDEVEITDTRYSEIGRMTLGEIPNKVNFAMMSYGIYFSPILAFWFRWKSNKNLKTTISGASPYLQYHAKSVMTGLALQVFMHFIFYIPLFSLYLYSLYTGTEILFQQFFLAMSPNLAATFDPLINLYYVVPYRMRIKSWFERSQPQQTSPLRVASITPSAIG